MKNAIIYCRVASREQADQCALQSQEQMCLDYANKNNLRVCATFKEAGLGMDNKRPFIGYVIDYLRQNQIEFVLVSEYNRISRNMVEAVTFNKVIDQVGARLICANNSKIEDYPVAKLVDSMLSQFAQFEREIRVMQAMRGYYRKGKSIFRRK